MLKESEAVLEQIFADNQISTSTEDLQFWGKDWTNGFDVKPTAIVFPQTNEQVVDLVNYAISNNVALVPSGGRTGLSGGAVASSGEVVVSFDRMNKILDFNPEDRLVTCQAGVVTETLQNFAEEQGLFYPVDFASAGSSQIGGNISTNAGGIKVIRYGLTRDWVGGLRVVTGTGALLDLNAGLIKNATGYDLRHLFVGSEGTLGLVCEADMRLAPKPAPQTVMVLGVGAVGQLLDVLKQFNAAVNLSAFEFFSDVALDKVRAHRDLPAPLSEGAPFYALLEFDEAELTQASDAFVACMEAGWVSDGVVSQSEAQANALWQLREGISESIAAYTPYKNDLSVSIAEVPEFLAEVDAFVAESYPGFEVCWYGHIGDGNLHLNILRPDDMSIEEFMVKGHAMSPKIFALVQARRGSISAEHGVGLLKKDFLNFSRSDQEIDLMRSLKNLFDPHQIMNPGKLLEG